MRADLIRAISAFDQREWMSGALCTQIGDPDLHFPSGGDRHAARAARRVCRACDVRAECLELGMTGDALYHGIYAGLSPHQRQALHAKRRTS